MHERDVEALLHDEVKRIGGWTIKNTPTIAGTPDRTVFLPNGQAHLVELKVTGGTPDPVQVVWAMRSKARGWPVTCLAGRAQVLRWCKTQRDLMELGLPTI